MISDTIEIDAGPGIDALKAFADAAKEAAAEFKAAFADVSKAMDLAGTGPDKFAASWGSAIAKVKADLADLGTSAGKLDSIGAGAAGAADKLKAVGDAGKGAADGLKAAGDGGKAAADGLESAGTSASAAADKLKAVGESGTAAADGLKGVGDSAKENEAFLAGFNATMAESIALSKDLSKASSTAAADVASAQRLNTAAAKMASDDAVAAQAAQAKAAKQAAADAEASSRKASLAILGGAAAVGYGIDQAAKLQTSVTRLYTSAGESQKNLPMMTQGILALSGQTATSQAELGQGAYMVESGGYHGKDALSILRAAAQGAKAEGAPLGEVGNALTSLMTSYKMQPSDAIAAMNQIIAMVGSGKMTMAGAVSALPQLLPASAAAGLSFGQAGGALATMTQTGMSPDQAAQNLRHTIGALQGPNSVQGAEMYQLGLDPVTMAKNFGKTGLTGTVAEIQAAVKAHTGKGGLVQLDTMNASKAATADALVMLKQLPPALRTLGKAYLDNGITQKQWMTDLKGLPPLQANLGHQFATTANLAHGFNAALKSGQPTMQTSSAALQKLLGGTVGFQTFLMLSGQHMSAFRANAAGVSAAAKDAGMNVKGWADIQKTFNFQLGAFKYSAEAAATTIGAAFLPVATDIMSGLAKAGSFFAGHKTLTVDLAIAGGAIGLINLGKKIAAPIQTAIQTVGTVAKALHIPGLDKLANIGKDSSAGMMAEAAAGNQRAGDTMVGAAGAMQRAADTMVGADAVGGKVPPVIPGEKAPPGETPPVVVPPGEKTPPREPKTPKTPGAGDALLGLLVVPFVDQALKSQRNSHGNWLDNAFGTPKTSAWNSWSSLGHDAATLWGLLPQVGHSAGMAPPVPGGGVYSRVAGPAPVPVPAPTPRVATPPAPPQYPLTPAQMAAGTLLHPASAKLPLPEQTAKFKLALDESSLTAAQSKAKAAIQSITQSLGSTKPAKVPAPDLSQVDGAKAKAASAANAIQAALENPLHKVVRAHAPDLGPYAAARGPAEADGVAISQGLASGINAGAGAAVAAAQHVANMVTSVMASALQTHSPSKITEAMGEDVSGGLAKGISSHKSKAKVKAATMTITASAVNSLVAGLQGGQSAIDAASTALGTVAKPQDIAAIQSAVASLQTQLNTGVSKKIVSKSEDSALVKWLKADQAKLDALATKRAVLEQQITDSQQIAQSAISGASIMNAETAYQAGPVTPISSSDLIGGMQAQADQAKQFAAEMGKLRGEGLNATTLNQVIQSGAASGLPVAQGIDSGGKQAVAQLNQLQSQIQASAAKLGNTGAPVMYQAGLDAGKGLATGLKAQLGAVDAQMKAIASQMVNVVKTAVGGNAAAAMRAAGASIGDGLAAGIESAIAKVKAAAEKLAQAAESGAKNRLQVSSPSRLFFGIGTALPQGLARGVDAESAVAEAAVSRMASRAAGAYGRSGGGYSGYTGGRGGGGGGAPVVNYHTYVTVQGSVQAEKDLASTVASHITSRGSYNWQTGIVPPGRKA